MRRVFLAWALLLLGVACSSGDDSKESATTSSTTETTNATGATVLNAEFGSAPVSTKETGPATLTAVEIGKHDGFVRVVYRFSDHVPGLTVEHAKPPFMTDGQGAPVEVAGSGFITVRLNANAHDEEGQPTLTTPRRIAGPSGSGLTEAVMLGDFEAIVSWVIGTDGVRPFKVFTLSKPSRVVVDIKS